MTTSNVQSVRYYCWFDLDSNFRVDEFTCDAVCTGLFEMAKPWGPYQVRWVDNPPLTPEDRARCAYCRELLLPGPVEQVTQPADEVLLGCADIGGSHPVAVGEVSVWRWAWRQLLAVVAPARWGH